MIKAIVEGRKTQTRRLSGLKKINQEPNKWRALTLKDKAHFWGMIKEDFTVVKPRYQVGEVVYIKEAWAYGAKEQEPHGIIYKLDGVSLPTSLERGSYGAGYAWGKWASPSFLKAEDARYYIRITDVRAERLRDITLSDIYDEGIDVIPSYDRIDAFKKLWDSLNKPPYDWNSNCWVWKYSFERTEK